MPPVRTTKSVSPPASDSPHYSDFVPSGSIPPSQFYEAPASPSQKKKRSHGKARPPGHIPRPPNAFIIFRTDQIKAMETQNSTPEVSKSLGELWRMMNDEQRQPYIERAKLAKIEHQIRHPDYKYKPIHPRDEFGNCIRKPRNPNRPRVNKKPAKADDADTIDEEQLSWFEGQTATGGSSNPLPPSTPSLPPSTPAQAQANFVPYSIPRRPSSVPLPMPTNTTWADLPQATYLGTQMGYYPSRRLSKRPSTSMNFVNSHGTHIVQTSYALSNALGDQFSHQTQQHQLQQHQQPPHAMQWHMGHRRSLSAPNFGELEVTAQFQHYPTFANYPMEANTLTPINPIFNNVFSNFTWSTDNHSSQPPISPESQQASNIQIPKVPPMSNNASASSNQSHSHVSASTVPQTPDPLIYHPAPVTTFNPSSLQDHVKQLETAASSYRFDDLIAEAARVENVGFDNMLGLSAPDNLVQQPMGYVDEHQNNIQTFHQIAPPRVLDFNELIVEGY